jgi:biotin carboxyl carrier protein
MQRRFKISVEGHDYDVVVEEIIDGSSGLYPDRGSMRTVHAEASQVVSQPASPAKSAERAPEAAGPGDVVSPLAGVVQSIDVTVGATVEADTSVIALEAMKTKTMVTAGRAGKVTAIAVEAGQGVDAGQTLLTID